MKISIYNVNDTPIGKGGMGQVYLGTDPNGNLVAVKEMLAQYVTNEELRKRFHQEVNILKQLEHPSIVKMYASFEERGNLYLVMEYVNGVTVDEYVRRHGALSEKEAIRIISELLSALHLVHSNGYVHRDIKPGNIMLRPDGSVCLLDFGIAKDMNRSNGQTSYTTVGTTIGTVGYMSPEQAEGLSIDWRSDIYSLGCVLFYMLTGQHAIKEESNEIRTRLSIINNPFPSVKLYNPTISDKIQVILNRATDKNMTKRFQSCGEFADLLNYYATQQQPESSPASDPKIRKIPSSEKLKQLLWYSLGAVAIALIIVSCWLLFRDNYPTEVIASEVIPKEIRTQYDMVQDSLYCGLVLVKKNDKYGYLDKTGKEIISLSYDEALPFSEGLAAVMREDKWGFINHKGKTVIPLIYNDVLSFQKGVALVQKDWKWGMIDKKNIEITPFVYQKGFPIKNGVAAFKKKDKWALLDDKGKEITEFIYDGIRINEYPYLTIRKDEKEGVIDINGKTVIPIIYDDVRAFVNGIARAKKDEKWGILDLTGKIIIPFENELVYWENSHKMLIVNKEKNKYEYYKINGCDIIPFNYEYDYISGFSEGLAQVKKDKKYGFIDTLYNLVIPTVYDDVEDFSDGLACVLKYGVGCGFIDKKGKTVIPLHYYFVFSFSDNLAPAVQQGGNGKVGFIDKSERVVIPFEYDFIHLFSDNLAAVQKKGKWGYIDRQGREITPFIYQEAGDFNGTIAWVKMNGKYGCINNFGKEIIPPVYDELIYFSNYIFIPDENSGYFKIVMSNSFGEFDPSLLTKKQGVTGKYAIVKKHGKEGVIKNDGTIVIPFVYDSLGSYARGLLRATRNEQVVYVDKTGKEYSQSNIED